MKNLVLFFGLFLTITSFSQSINGVITEKINDKNEPIPFANVLVKELNKGASTDFDGQYNIAVAPGTYTIEVSFVGYKPQTLSVTVASNEKKELNVLLASNTEVMEEFVVEAKLNRESKSMDIVATKQANGLESNLGATKMAEVGASNASDATKKIVGLSVVGSGYVFVRGMGDRYNSAYMNGLPIASPDPDKKVIPLNIFPSSVIQSLSVKKSFTTDFEGDFSGGAIDIRTKDYPEEKTFKVSLGTGFNSQTLFREVMTSQGGKYDYFGFDNTRVIPEGIKNQEAYRSTEGDKLLFPSNFNPVFKKAMPNSSFGLYTGDFVDLKGDKKLGYVISLNHSNSNSYEFGKYRLYNAQGEAKIDYDVESFNVSTSTSALGNIYYEFNDNHNINYNLLYVNLSSNEARETFGFHFDYPTEVYSRRYTYRQNSLLVNQLTGNHSFLKEDKLRFHWNTSFNNAFSKEPDRRQLVYQYTDREATDTYVINARDRIDNHRFFSELAEKQLNAKAELKYIFSYTSENKEDGEKTALTLGAFYKNKSREFDYKQYVYDLGDINLNNPNGTDVYNPDAYINQTTHEAGDYVISEALNPASAYEADQVVMATYGALDHKFNEYLGVIVGARMENANQTILYRDQTQPAFLRKEILSAINVLPSLIAKYQINDTNIIRASFSKTISRPGFKEVAPFEYIAVFAGAKTIGNPMLQNGENYNVDLRYERYPRFGEFMAVGVFYKNLINPIEKTMEVTASGQLQSFRNADKATLAGVEFEWNKNLGFLTSNDSSILKNFSVGLNASYLYSKVSFDTSINVAQTNSERALQGASPYLLNADLSYTKRYSEKLKSTFTLSYNVFGKRIYNVGIQGIGDIYEMPVNALNFIALVDYGKFNFNLKVKNILNPLINYEQTINDRTFVVNQTRRGVFTSITVGYTF